MITAMQTCFPSSSLVGLVLRPRCGLARPHPPPDSRQPIWQTRPEILFAPRDEQP